MCVCFILLSLWLDVFRTYDIFHFTIRKDHSEQVCVNRWMSLAWQAPAGLRGVDRWIGLMAASHCHERTSSEDHLKIIWFCEFQLEHVHLNLCLTTTWISFEYDLTTCNKWCGYHCCSRRLPGLQCRPSQGTSTGAGEVLVPGFGGEKRVTTMPKG